LTEALREGEMFKNPFSGRNIQKGKTAYQKIRKDCQKYKIELERSRKKSLEEIDIEDLFSDD
jgi:uncharacterized protein (DUF488 family)